MVQSRNVEQNGAYAEHLSIRPLIDGRVHTHFSFDVREVDLESHVFKDIWSTNHYNLLPRALMHTAQAGRAEEIALSINRGMWDYGKWGHPMHVHGDVGMVGSGAELWARLRGSSNETTESAAQPSEQIMDGDVVSPAFVVEPMPVGPVTASGQDEQEETKSEANEAYMTGEKLEYDLNALNMPFELEMRWRDETSFAHPHDVPPPELSVSRSFVGAGQERGRVQLMLRNIDPKRERNVLYYDVLPWFVRPYLHSLNTTLELDEWVPPASTLLLTYDYDKAFMRYEEHPPDAHRGFDLPPAVIVERVRNPNDGNEVWGRRWYTAPALLEVAVPDFSPYNV
ncbi:GPI transamidase complex, GPI16/PIG-T component, involved in glycosylphosphatidylinositol anchor biosynthesis [Ceraceosorus bombacis]|uniref:GPI transamidase complex, GPI16/PIG-T component, involved in glycosylphosphatidylinositol anchor biosynthesis n=1 Tax=Ceraceosorus bombacis TaxID=401625 RepID=A0A0P1B8H4_9BASI|nr:GPI transamidase complex, GPI16/PIG-T component, involved in glycosylphosphatidylinositol anchor biosynthesis [Ceraceosorus bombacis]